MQLALTRVCCNVLAGCVAWAHRVVCLCIRVVPATIWPPRLAWLVAVGRAGLDGGLVILVFRFRSVCSVFRAVGGRVVFPFGWVWRVSASQVAVLQCFGLLR